MSLNYSLIYSNFVMGFEYGKKIKLVTIMGRLIKRQAMLKLVIMISYFIDCLVCYIIFLEGVNYV